MPFRSIAVIKRLAFYSKDLSFVFPFVKTSAGTRLIATAPPPRATILYANFSSDKPNPTVVVEVEFERRSNPYRG
jgi:hypothetical protein